jgi:hypothetical protein
MRERLLLGTLAACLLCSSAGAAPPPFGGNRNLHVEVDFNFLTHAVNQWVSSGAFNDSGTIRHDHSEVFKGVVANVTDSPEGAHGSFTWSFVKAYTGPLDGKPHITVGTWTMTGGTGDYEGISGRGTVSGQYNIATGELHDVFDGTVDCPNCP